MKTKLIYFIVGMFMFVGCGDSETVVPAPEILSFSPTFGHEGDEVVIEGRNFSNTLAGNTVRFNGSLASVTEASATMLKVQVPTGITDGKISVKVGEDLVESAEEFVLLVDLEKEIQQAMSSSGIPSLALSVISGSEVVFSKGFGKYDAQRTLDADENTLYVTSSISKLVVSIAVMQQVEQGRANLDGDISDYVGFQVRNPNFPDKVITVRMVMEHGSSLANPGAGEIIDDVFFGHDPDSAIALHPIIEDAITPGSTIYRPGIWKTWEPGTVHTNSNYGITLLGYMVEQLSGLHFNDYSQTFILQPLGMNSSSFHYPDLDGSKVAAIFDQTGSVFAPFSHYFYPAGMMHTSTSDWSKFLLMMLNGGSYQGAQILQPTSVDMLMDVKYPAGNQIAFDSSIGLVWRQAAGSEGWIGHTGGGLGITHITEINRTTNTAYVLFSNRQANHQVVGPGGTLYSKIHRWIGQIGLE